MATPCESVRFTETEFDVGYIPAGTDVVITGLAGVVTAIDFPFASFNITVSTQCAEVKFPNQSGVYNQSSYDLQILRGQTVYIPFRINLGSNCGEYSCEIKYLFQVEVVVDNVVTTYTCESFAKIVAYNATCDFQECLLKSSETYCDLDQECEADICNDPCYQRFIRLSTIDDILRYKIDQKDWPTVNNLYQIALEQICNCNCDGTKKIDATPKQIREVTRDE